MSALEKRYRRNFVVVIVLHIGIVGAIVCWEQFLAEACRPSQSTYIIVPAELLGEMPVGKGIGKGAHKAAEATVSEPTPAPQHNLAGDEGPAPTKPQANEVALPSSKPKPKKPVTENKPASKPVAVAATKSKPGGSAADIKKRFENVLANSANGTPYGDNKPPGGGTGKSGPIGSSTGTKDGVPWGVGQGTPNWQYYQRVHDVLYEAWEQPGSALDKKLMTTIALRIARDGSITEASVRIGSGNKLMDESVLSAVRKVLRLDPPPDNLVRGDSASISVNFQIEG